MGSPGEPERGVIDANLLYTYDRLMARMPEGTSKDAIRKLVDDGALPVHRIGHFNWFWGAEVIAASRVGRDDLRE